MRIGKERDRRMNINKIILQFNSNKNHSDFRFRIKLAKKERLRQMMRLELTTGGLEDLHANHCATPAEECTTMTLVFNYIPENSNGSKEPKRSVMPKNERVMRF
jgi:hypothetical protein